MKKYSLTKHLLQAVWISDGLVANSDGSFSKVFELSPLPSGLMEDSFQGPITDTFFSKLSDLLTRLPNLFDGQVLLSRQKTGSAIAGFCTTLYFLEKVAKPESFSHFAAVAAEIKLIARPMTREGWSCLLSTIFGEDIKAGRWPDLLWETGVIKAGERTVRTLSLTELPQLTWKGCFQPLFETPHELLLSLRLSIPERNKIRRQLETKRRVSHALAVTSSLEVKNIESNSVLHSSEETLERILINKETLFEVSVSVIISGGSDATLSTARDFERVVSGVGNAGLFMESVGTMPVLKSHLPGEKMLNIRKLPMLSENLSHILPIFHDYSRQNDFSSLELRSRSGEVCHLNLFSRENLNFNSFICGASGSGKSFLMNAILTSALKDESAARLCIFDVGGSYRRIVESSHGKSVSLSHLEAQSLIATFLRSAPVSGQGFYRAFVETLCGSGSHITHSHSVAIDDLLREMAGETLKIETLTANANSRPERFYQDIAHWLKPHVGFDALPDRPELLELIKSQVSAFDFKELDSDPVLQRTTILLLTELLWRDLMDGRYPRTIIVFDEVWRFFAQSKGFLEEMYRTLRKYKAGIVSITQNLADYGDEAFSKMLFTNSFTKIFLQNGASAEYLRETFDLPDTDIRRALSVVSKKPEYSEFFALSPNISQVFRLYPTKEFYALANTENIATS